MTVTYFVPEDGKKCALVHDEEYCQVSGGAPGPPQTRSEQMDADSAEADMNAAYFMRETHNPANVTAWMLEPDQVSWIGVRQQTCGVTLACRIRRTRADRRSVTALERPVGLSSLRISRTTKQPGMAFAIHDSGGLAPCYAAETAS